MSSFDHRWIGVAKRHGAQAHAVLDELVAVEIPRMASLSAHHEPRRFHRKLIVALGISVRAAGNQLMRVRLQCTRTGVVAGGCRHFIAKPSAAHLAAFRCAVLLSTILRAWNASAYPLGEFDSMPRIRIRPRNVSRVNHAFELCDSNAAKR